ncbi:MAG TPA: type II secretion system ATPase GspE [Desulfobacteria bacterium]|nr:type II secretion system ATPase GspE [Desulfobacteria bacterium]
MFIPVRKRLGELLLEENLITEGQLQEALAKQKESGQRLGQAIISLGFIDQMTVLRVLEAKLGIPVMNINRRVLDSAAVKMVPEALAQKYKIIPVEMKGDSIVLAMADPLNVMAIDDVRISTGRDVEPVIASDQEIDDAISSYYGRGSIDRIIEDLPEDLGIDIDESVLDQLREIVEDAPIVKLANSLLAQAVASRASDIHLEPREKELRVRYRVDGVLTEVTKFPKRMQAPIISRFKIMANLDIAERRIPQDGRIKMKIENKEIDFRVSTLPTIVGEKVVLRILDKSMGLISLQELGMVPEVMSRFRHVINQPHGIILVTGPTGSGKTTTLYATLGDINSSEKNIITLEDPVEYTLEGINQVQLNIKAGLTFAGGLRSILRQDPDVIMVGEIRDSETARIAIQSAMTGHLVLSTLHTNTAAATLIRLVEMGIEPFLVASSVVGIIAQRLVRRLCPECKEPYEPSDELVKKFQLSRHDDKKLILFGPKGCPMCGNTGFKGRLALQEVLFMSSKIKDRVTAKATASVIEAEAANEGMALLWEDGLRKVLLGITSLEEVMRAVYVSD